MKIIPPARNRWPALRGKWPIAAVTACMLLTVSGVFAIRSYAAKTTAPAGLRISGLPVGGMPLTEMVRQLEDITKQLSVQQVHLSSTHAAAHSAGVKYGDLGLTIDSRGLLHLLQPLTEGSWWSRAKARYHLSNRNLPLDAQIDPDVLDRQVRAVWSAIYAQQPADARREISSNDQVKLIPDQIAYRIDTEALIKRLEAPFARPDWLHQWKQGAAAAQIPLPVQEVRAAVTLDMLKKQGVERLLSEFTTVFPTGQSGRVHNIRAAASTIHDKLLAPGEVFDYEKIILQAEKTYGFLEAPVILNGVLVPGIGGGICQVSTTLYNAVLRSGLEVLERRNHSLPVSYVPMGIDATFSRGYINFRFRNNTKNHLLIRSELANGKLTVKLFGQIADQPQYEFETIVVKELPPPERTVVNPSLAKGKRETIQRGKAGHVVETYRITKKNGVVISREILSRDTYSPQPTIIAIGGPAVPNGDTPGKTPVLEDGIRGPVYSE